MKSKQTDRRKDNKTRDMFDKVISDLKSILSCYDKKYHYAVIMGYFKAYDIMLDNRAKGRILYILGQL